MSVAFRRAAIAAVTLATVWVFGASTPDPESVLGFGESEASAQSCEKMCAAREKKCGKVCADKLKDCTKGCEPPKTAQEKPSACWKKCTDVVPQCIAPCVKATSRCRHSC